MINVQQYKSIDQGIQYLQNIVVYSNAKKIVIKHVEIFEDALVDDSALRTWCNTNYSRKQTVYSGLDRRMPPGEPNTPYVSVSGLTEQSGYNMRANTFLLDIRCVINDTSITTATDTNGVVHKKYDGMQNVEDMRKLTETAIVNILDTDDDLSGSLIGEVEIGYKTIGYFPFFYSNSVFAIDYTYSQGDSVFNNRR